MDDVATPAAIPKEPFFSELKGSATVRIPKSRPWLSRGNRAVSEGPRAVLEGSQATEVGCGGDELESEAVPAAADDGENAELVSSTSPSTEEIAEAAISGITEEASKLTPEERWHEASKAELEEKVVKETAKHFARGEFWFAYDFDLTTPLQRKHDTLKRASRHAPASSTSSTSSSTSGSRNHPEPVPFDEPLANLPLWRRVDKRFWHNEHLARDFVNAGLHAFILPLIQGYFQITTLPIEPSRKVTNVAKKGEEVESNKKTEEEVVEEEKDPIEAQLLIISRRSKERAGLRYQRRGINEQGQVANYVETEQILFVKHQGTAHLASFVQFRGSIPLYWSQSPFSLKPPPVLERSKEENLKACAKHFDQQIQRYGKVTCVNLAEQSGKEGHISEAYRLRVADLKRGDAIQYVDFDFHKECSGMKFENVQKLIEQMMPTLAEMSFFWRSCPSSSGPSAGTTIHSEQKGAFRVSCLDCLDRTNVVQSSFGRHMLNVQLDKLKIRPRANETDANSDKIAFNDLWANNANAISHCYSNTDALKVDFTRTGKRSFLGMINDATNSVYRMVQGAVTDFFRQTVLDFAYGSIGLGGLERYYDDLDSRDPSETVRLARVRASAIQSCKRDVVPEGEQVLGGWTLFSPVEQNKVHSMKLEEKVALLTSKAIYVCRYDFGAESLLEFTRVLIGDITGLQEGLYIISPNEGYHPEDNWGFVISYLNEERR
ncbi:hypothetical protein IE53DRAFT_308310 [Violaceomyces palustris]|uniref:Uncharacterized protein n=1 Tax=Violaceomyces palustris TaxID=1673888 RepID=A0ACD0P8W4_9BASI|nr:hypothetical protein IE53DRAFT_308310 [Violaceomyces palustris]